MANQSIVLSLEGPEAEAAAKQLQAWFVEHLDGWRVEILPRVEGGHDSLRDPSDPARAIDPATLLAAATLVISIPPSILATWDLARRMALRDKFEALAGRLQDLTRQRSGLCGRFDLGGPDNGRALDRVEADRIAQALHRLAQEARPGGEPDQEKGQPDA